MVRVSYHYRRSLGFTLIETLIVLALMLIVLSVSLGLGFEVLPRLYRTNVEEVAIRLLWRARAEALATNASVGVEFAPSQLTLFVGGDLSQGKVIDQIAVDPQTLWSGDSVVVFQPTWGLLANTATVTVQFNNATKTIMINHAGAITW